MPAKARNQPTAAAAAAPTPTASEAKGKGSVLPLFPLLSSHDPVTRLDASLSLLTTLPFNPSSKALDSDDADTPYTIKRLVTGLGSSNDAARQGFAVALAELLARLPSQKATEVLPLVIVSSTPTAGSDSREERELLFARLFGLHAVVRSGVLFREAESNAESFKEVILALLALSGRKSWIRESAFWVLIEGVKALLSLEEASVPAWRDEIVQWVIQRLLNDSREKARGWGPEKIALVLVLQSYGVEADYASILAPSFPSGNLLSRASLTALAQALKGTAADADASGSSKAPKMGSNAVKTSRGGAPTPGAAPHFVWGEIFDLYFPDDERKVAASKAEALEGRAKWSEVWRILVDQSLFAPPSLPLKATGFALLMVAMQRLPPAEVPTLFGEGVLRTFANHLRKTVDGEKTLNRVAEKLAASLPPFLTANPSVSLPMLKALIAPPHGSLLFDPRTVDKVVAKLDPKGVRGWVKYLKDFILGEEQTVEGGEAILDAGEEQKALVASRMWAFDQLLHVAKSGSLEKDYEVLAGLLEFFAVLGWFEVKKTGKGARSYVPVPAFGETLQMAARSRFFSILTALAPSSNGQVWLTRGLGLLDNLSADTKNFTSLFEIDDAVVAARKEAKAMYSKLSGDDERRKTARSLAEGVLLLSYDEAEEASEAVDGLKDCLRVLFPDVLPAAPATKDDEDDSMDGEEPEPATVLIDLLLELIHRPSAFIKNVAQIVFSGFSGEIGEQGIELLIEQIRPEEVADEAEGEDASMANGDDHEHQPKASTSKANGKAKAIVDDEAESSDDDDEDDEDDSDAEVDEDFRNELLAALQASGVADEFDAQEEANDGEEEEEELLDDDQMMALDDKLADIFRLQVGGRKGKKADRMDDLHYRLRVVDMLETLAKQRATNPLLVHVVLPLFSIVRRSTTLEKELQTKSLKLLRQIVGARKELPNPSSPRPALDALQELHTVAQTVDEADFASLCSQTAIFLVKAALSSPAANAKTSKSISKLFGDSFEQYLVTKNSKTRVQPALTLEFVRRAPACAWPLFAQVVALAGPQSTAVNAYRRMQAFEIAQALLNSYAALKTDESKKAIVAGIPAFRDAIHSLLASAVTDEKSALDASRLKELVKLALAGVRITTAASDATKAKAIWRGEDFAPLLEALKDSSRFSGAVAVQRLLAQLLVVLGAQETAKVSKKRKGDDAGAAAGAAASDKKAKKTRKGKAVEPEGEVEVEVEDETVDGDDDDVDVVEVPAPKASKKEKKNKKDRKR